MYKNKWYYDSYMRESLSADTSWEKCLSNTAEPVYFDRGALSVEVWLFLKSIFSTRNI